MVLVAATAWVNRHPRRHVGPLRARQRQQHRHPNVLALDIGVAVAAAVVLVQRHPAAQPRLQPPLPQPQPPWPAGFSGSSPLSSPPTPPTLPVSRPRPSLMSFSGPYFHCRPRRRRHPHPHLLRQQRRRLLDHRSPRGSPRSPAPGPPPSRTHGRCRRSLRHSPPPPPRPRGRYSRLRGCSAAMLQGFCRKALQVVPNHHLPDAPSRFSYLPPRGPRRNAAPPLLQQRGKNKAGSRQGAWNTPSPPRERPPTTP